MIWKLKVLWTCRRVGLVIVCSGRGLCLNREMNTSSNK